MMGDTAIIASVRGISTRPARPETAAAPQASNQFYTTFTPGVAAKGVRIESFKLFGYRGATAQLLLAEMRRGGGLIEPEHQVEEVDRFGVELRGHRHRDADREAAVGKIRENIKIPRHTRMEVAGQGMVAAYIHTGAKVGVLVEVGAGKDATVASDDFKQLVRDITLQIAAGDPRYVLRRQVERARKLRRDRGQAQPAAAGLDVPARGAGAATRTGGGSPWRTGPSRR